MRILIIKLSSIGDLIHTFPALVDAKSKIKNLIIDWLVDEEFIEIVELQQKFVHPTKIRLINKIISIPLRKLKFNFFHKITSFSISNFIKNLRSVKYDLIIDAQGLLKSAIIAKFANGSSIFGFDFITCKEPIASFLYNNKINVSKELHAIVRLRELFAKSLKYQYEVDKIDHGLDKQAFVNFHHILPRSIKKYMVFLHGTTWETKHWDPEYWVKLTKLLQEKKIHLVVMVYNIQQRELANKLAASNPKVIILDKLNFFQIATILANASCIVAVDTGFAHLAVSLDVPIIGIYGATSAIKSGISGDNSINLQSQYHCSPCLARSCLEYQRGKSKIKQPCLTEITPEIVMQHVVKFI